MAAEYNVKNAPRLNVGEECILFIPTGSRVGAWSGRVTQVEERDDYVVYTANVAGPRLDTREHSAPPCDWEQHPYDVTHNMEAFHYLCEDAQLRLSTLQGEKNDLESSVLRLREEARRSHAAAEKLHTKLASKRSTPPTPMQCIDAVIESDALFAKLVELLAQPEHHGLAEKLLDAVTSTATQVPVKESDRGKTLIGAPTIKPTSTRSNLRSSTATVLGRPPLTTERSQRPTRPAVPSAMSAPVDPKVDYRDERPSRLRPTIRTDVSAMLAQQNAAPTIIVGEFPERDTRREPPVLSEDSRPHHIMTPSRPTPPPANMFRTRPLGGSYKSCGGTTIEKLGK